VLSQEGLEIVLTVSIRFYPVIELLGHLHQDIGPDYFVRLIKPKVESHLRKTIGDRTAYQLYSNEGDILQEASRLDLAALSGDKSYIQIDELLIKYVVLPKVVNDAIETKHREEQRVMEYEYRVKREEQEAERKRIEATGIRDYNHIAKEVSPDLLRWRGIDATLQLAKSANSKIIIVGNSQDGLPLILDTNTAVTQDSSTKISQVPGTDDILQDTDAVVSNGEKATRTPGPSAP
jgi:regulator of protease activity HflC (stomatin/prohibitin superfamily)